MSLPVSLLLSRDECDTCKLRRSGRDLHLRLPVLQAQYRLLVIEGARGAWEPVVVNVLGWGTGSMLVWSACLHRLPYNRSVCLSMLQLCVLMLQNGPHHRRHAATLRREA